MQKFPILEKEHLREMYKRKKNLRGKNLLYKSGGTTGEPISILSSVDHSLWLRASVLRSYDWIGFKSGEKRARLFAAPTKNGISDNNLKNRFQYWMANNKFYDVSSINETDVLDIVSSLKKWNPKFIMGYTSSLSKIATVLLEKKETLNIPELIIVNAAEHLSKETRTLIEFGFGGRMFDHYGTREIGYVADECEERSGMHVNMEYLFVEIVTKKENGLVKAKRAIY